MNQSRLAHLRRDLCIFDCGNGDGIANEVEAFLARNNLKIVPVAADWRAVDAGKNALDDLAGCGDRRAMVEAVYKVMVEVI